jgi:hypothetical protein
MEQPNFEHADTPETPELPSMDAASADNPTGTPMERFFYHQRRALEETAKALESLLPPGFKEHATEASREFSKGFRILVDATIDELKKVSEKEEEPAKTVEAAEATIEAAVEEVIEEEKKEEVARKPSTGKTKVKVKVE